MSNNDFDGEILEEKLSKLNSSQQTIESLSRWCISHRKKARQIVEKWDKLFNSSRKEQCVSFLYLANDILQNSRRKGSEFVNEFWKVLPGALKHVLDTGGEHGKKVVTRLVDIWEERKVFGSRGQGLKNEILGNKSSTPIPSNTLSSNGKSSNPIKIVKKDAHFVRFKLGVGGVPERILTAFHSVFDQNLNEEATLDKFDAVVSHLGRIAEVVRNTSNLDNQHGTALLEELQEQETKLHQYIVQLESAEAAQALLTSQLKEALIDQESKLQLIHAQMQVAQGQVNQATNLRNRLIAPSVPGPSIATTSIPITEAASTIGQEFPPSSVISSFAPQKTTSDEESKKAAVAAIAAKLTASTSSAQMLSSVFSSLAAEEAASMFSPEKRPKLDQPVHPGGALPPLPPPPPPPPPPPLSASNQTANQYVQPSMMVGVMPYGYRATPPMHPPAMPPHPPMGLAQQPQQQQQAPPSGGFYRPPGIGFYGQNNQPAPPPVPRQ